MIDIVCILKDKNKILLKIFYYSGTKYKYSEHNMLIFYYLLIGIMEDIVVCNIILEYRLFSCLRKTNNFLDYFIIIHLFAKIVTNIQQDFFKMRILFILLHSRHSCRRSDITGIFGSPQLSYRFHLCIKIYTLKKVTRSKNISQFTYKML